MRAGAVPQLALVIGNAFTLNNPSGTCEQPVLGLPILLSISVDALRFRVTRSIP